MKAKKAEADGEVPAAENEVNRLTFAFCMVIKLTYVNWNRLLEFQVNLVDRH